MCLIKIFNLTDLAQKLDCFDLNIDIFARKKKSVPTQSKNKSTSIKHDKNETSLIFKQHVICILGSATHLEKKCNKTCLICKLPISFSAQPNIKTAAMVIAH